MYSTDIELMVKQSNILGRLARGGMGAIKGVPKGMFIGGALGALAAPLSGAGLAAALGVGGAGAFSGAMMGGGLRGAIGGVRGLLKSPNASSLPKHIRQATANQQAAFRAGSALPAVGIGGGLGYMVSDDDNKLMGTTLGVVGGLMARPAVMRALRNRRAA